MHRHELVEVAQTEEAPQEKKKRVRDEQTLREWNGSVQPRRNVSVGLIVITSPEIVQVGGVRVAHGQDHVVLALCRCFIVQQIETQDPVLTTGERGRESVRSQYFLSDVVVILCREHEMVRREHFFAYP